MLYSLRALRACRLRLCVVSACGALAAGEAEKLRGLADALVVRDNAGLDFASWQTAIALGLTDGFSHVLLANDSVYGPFRPLQPFLQQAMQDGVDAWGMVESRERGWHLQSWFMALSATTMAHPPVAAILAANFAAMTKAEIIAAGELGMGAALVACGAVCGAASAKTSLPLAQRRWPVNRMHFDWFSLASSGAVPFLKIELLRDNPLRIAGVGQWRKALKASDYPPALIENHLRRIGPRNAVVPEGWSRRLKRRLFALLVSRDRTRMLSGRL